MLTALLFVGTSLLSTSNLAGRPAGIDAGGLADLSLMTIQEDPILPEDREHWAFRPLVRPEPPEVEAAEWVRNPVDRFILAKLEGAGLSPSPEADRTRLIRRLSFDLRGLPPTPKEVDAFVADSSKNAYESLVDAMLDSRAYGERWAQYWLDLARFAETNGFHYDGPRSWAWRYRDWVIDALNADMPYDEFVRLQLAADELRSNDAEAGLATQFVLCAPDDTEYAPKEGRRQLRLNDIVSTVGSVFLGLQFACAQCHDHKYDPVSQADFYRLRAFFDNTDLQHKTRLGGTLAERSGRAPASHLMIGGDFLRPGPILEPAYPRIANPWGDEPPPPGPKGSSAGRRAALAHWLTRPDHPLLTRVIVNRLWQHHFGKGLVRTASDFGRMGDEPTHPKLLDWLATELPRQSWSLKHMHKLMVTSATYRQASRPSTEGEIPANDDMPGGHIDESHRRWRYLREVDPENRLLACMNRQRLEGEVIRDAMLAASGRLNRDHGGPGIMVPLPEEVLAGLAPNQNWKVSRREEDHCRRSIYLYARRNLRYPLFEAFDRPQADQSCPKRRSSTTAPQALILLNSELSLSVARWMAGFVLAHAPPDESSRIALCFRRALGRPPTDEELSESSAFLKRQAARLRDEGRDVADLPLPDPSNDEIDPYAGAAWTNFCLAVFNLNEFIYVD